MKMGPQTCARPILWTRLRRDLKQSQRDRIFEQYGMEWIENTNLLGFCAQGIVGVGCFILMFTCSSPLGASRPIKHLGSNPGIDVSLSPSKLCRSSSVPKSVRV